jgi:uncharacterized protein HemX
MNPSSTLIDDIEKKIDAAREDIEQCRKAMVLARAAIIAALAIGTGVVFGLVDNRSFVAALVAFTAMIGGIVWYGSNKSSQEQAEALLNGLEEQRASLIDQLGLHTVTGERNGPGLRLVKD